MQTINNKPLVTSSIRFLSGPLAGRVFQINKPITTIGRDPGNDIVIKDDLKVSSYHARLLWENGSWRIQKHPQAHRLTINSQVVQEAMITGNSTIGLGEDTSFLFLVDAKDHVSSEASAYSSQAQSSAVGSPLAAPTRPARANSQADQTQIAMLSSMGMPSLCVTSNHNGEQKTFLIDKPIINIGRDPSNDIVVNDQIVSAFHAQIVRQGDALVLVHPHPERQRTLNGLLYQGRKIRGDEHFRKVLYHGDFFRIGNENGAFVTLTYSDGSATQQDEVPPVRPIKLNDREITIGRMPDNTVVLSHPQVSGHHVRLVREGGTYRIFDLGSTNHVYVNAQLVTNHLLKMNDEIRLGPYRLIYEGTQLTEYDESKCIRVEALNLKKFGNNHATLLNNISLSIPPRTFVAIVGGSGAGKSTLMSALSGLRPANEGKVLYNGQDYYHNIAAFSSQIGYVPQDDIVHRDLTVERALYYAARMRLPGDFTREQINQRINEVLEDVEMTERRGQLIKKLSGGQRKRVSIALELLANPSLFFLDEPTSGLDPSLDRKMMYLLRKLADKGHTIILVTHATNNLSACDYVCFLAPGGRLAYFGPPEEAKVYFGKHDFSEMYSVLEPTAEKPFASEEAEVAFRASREYQQHIAQPLREELTGVERVSGAAKDKQTRGRSRRGNPLKQFLLLCMRRIELLKNNKSNLAILLLQAPLIATLLMLLVRFEISTGIFDANKLVQCRSQVVTTSGVLQLPGVTDPTALIDCKQVVNFLHDDANGRLYAQEKGGGSQALQDFIVPSLGGGDAQRVIFLVSFLAVMFGIINASREIVKEIAIYEREHTVNLGIFPYMFSKIAVLGSFALLQSVAMLFIVNTFEPFSQGVFLPVLLEIYIPLALSAVAGVMIGLVLSALVADEDSVSSFLPLVIIIQVILAGAIIPLKDWFTMVIATIAPTRWAAVALGSTLGLHSDKIDGGKLFGDDPTYHGTLFSIYSQSNATQHIVLAWMALGVIILVLTCAISFSLKLKDIRR